MRFIIFVVGALLLLLALAGVSLGLSTQGKQDYGDAPDGRPTGYGPAGQFPSLLKSDGARAADTTVAFLGERANKEGNARIVDRDRFDDGVDLNLKSCQKSEAFVVVTKPSATGTAYVNLLFDWNEDGQWSGKAGGCGARKVDEWTVKNFKIDLSKQAGRQAIYRVPFRAGRIPHAMWYRAILTVDEPWKDANGAGAFESGEVEDYRLGEPKARYSCQRTTLHHGTSGVLTIVPKGSSPRVVRSELHENTRGYENGGKADNEVRTIKRLSPTEYAYTSKEVHKLKRPAKETFRVVVNNDFTVKCKTKVIHEDLGPDSAGDVGDGSTGGGGGGEQGNNKSALANVAVSQGPIENINGVNQAWVCVRFDTIAGAEWQVTATFENSSNPFTTSKGKAAKDGTNVVQFNAPAEVGHVLNLLIAAKVKGDVKEFRKALKFALQAVGAKCPSR